MATGKSLAHDSAEMQVTGSALYTDDTVENAGELLVSFVGSPVAHGLLKRIDLSSLHRIPGFIGAFTWQDIPGANLFGPVIADEPFLVKDLCEYVGQPIVVLAAENSIALALIPREHALDGLVAEIEILGQMRKARVITTPLFDADGARMRG